MVNQGTLEDRIILVTGALGDIGAAVVAAIKTQGGTPVSLDVADSADPNYYKVDVTRELSVATVFERIGSEYGMIHGLVTCAGITRDGMLSEMTADDFYRVINVNLFGTFICMREARRYMTAERGGSIVTISSISSAGNKGQTNYSASKAGVNAMTVTAAAEWGRDNIRANAVLPGPVDGKMIGTVPDKILARWKQATPLGHVALPSDIAEPVVFLLGDGARHITGQLIPVSGGMHF